MTNWRHYNAGRGAVTSASRRSRGYTQPRPLGIRVFSVYSTRWTRAFFSRYCRGRFIWDLDSASPEKSVEYLGDVARKIGRWCILIPATDNATKFGVNHAAALSDLPHSESCAGAIAMQQKRLYHLAGKF